MTFASEEGNKPLFPSFAVDFFIVTCLYAVDEDWSFSVIPENHVILTQILLHSTPLPLIILVPAHMTWHFVFPYITHGLWMPGG